MANFDAIYNENLIKTIGSSCYSVCFSNANHLRIVKTFSIKKMNERVLDIIALQYMVVFGILYNNVGGTLLH